jgi:transposase
MHLEAKILREKTVQDIIMGKDKCNEAARKLGVTPRTVQNYIRRFREQGPEGLQDRRTGNHRKLSFEEEAAIVACKQERPQRSARLIRDLLRLNVSPEAVRLVIAKHDLNLYRKAS